MMRLTKKNIVLAVILLLSFFIACSFYYYARQSLTQVAVEKYQYQSDLHQKMLLNSLKEKRALLSLLAKQAAFDNQFNAVDFSNYLASLDASKQYNEICLLIPEQGFIFSTKPSEYSDCSAFSELSPSQVMNVHHSPKLMLSEHVFKQNQSIYIAIISDLSKIVDTQYNMGFDEYLLAFDPSNLVTQYYAISNAELIMSKPANIDDAIKHQFYTIETFDDIQLLYLSAFKDAHLPKHYFLVPLLFALLICCIPALISFYIIKLINERKLAKREVQYSERFLSLILENQPEIVFVKDQAFNITYANQNFLNMYPEEQRDKVIGYTSLEGYDPAEVEEFLAMDKKAFAEGYSEVVETINFPDKTRRTLLTKKIRFQGLDNEVYILGTASDITEREQLIKQLEHSNDELKQFAYRTSHDLKAPIIGIQRLAEFIQEDIDDGNIDEAKKNLEKVSTRSIKLLNLVADILALTKVDYSDAQTELIDFNGLIKEAVMRLEELAVQNAVSIETNIDENIQLYSVKARLTQVLENLISNALKYHDPSQQARYVSINVMQDCGQVVIKVKDNGVGIPDGKEKDLFEMFTRFNVKLAEGSGLGLAIVKKHIDQLNGIISAETQSNETIFTIRLANNGN